MKRIFKRLATFALALALVAGVFPVAAQQTSVLDGKTALFVGDSITFGDQDTTRGDGWAKRIADTYGMTTTNAGESGAVLSDAEGKKRLHSKFVEGDFDYVILQGGFNDMMVDGMEVGKFIPSRDPADFDTATFAGGLDRYFQLAVTMYPDARIGFIITYDMPAAYTWAMYPQADEFWAMAKELCAKWDIAYLDLYAPKYSEDILETGTSKCLASDGVHLNGNGYDVVAPHIASWMETLMPHSGVNKHPDDDTLDLDGEEITSFKHSYHSACDPMCFVCGEIREIAHVYDSDADAKCNVCGEKRRVDGDAHEHEYDNACDADCNICGDVREVEDHKYDNACDADCNVCGDEREVEDHKYDNACDADCNVCGDEREVTHDFKWVNDVPASCGANGWEHEECTVCHETRNMNTPIDATGEHEYDNACDANCNVCGYEREIAGHVYDNDRDTDCNVCGDVREIAPLKNGWVKEDGKWYFYENDVMVKNTWQKDSKGWVYLGADGYMLTNSWCTDSKGWCYVGADGYAVTNCWKKDSHGWIWLNANGSMTKNAWVKDGGKWYFLDANGYMVANQWRKDSKGWVYLGASGAMLTNSWCTDSKGWCYVGADGYAVTNCWKKDSKGWIWLNSNGSMTKSAWVKDGGKWYYLDGNGYMVANKSLKIKGKTYKFDASGVCTNP